jgi:hypothetical protein
MAEHWQAQKLVIDATGLGLGLASFLERALGESRLVRFTFTQKSKSELGWGFLALVESGRFKDYHLDANIPFNTRDSFPQARLKALFQLQAQYCESMILPGTGQILRWSVPENRRNPYDGSLLHDDLLVSAALCAELDHQPWGLAESAVVSPVDVLAGLGEIY